VALRLGIDVACRAAHQASLADERGVFAWSGHRFHTTPDELERLWSKLPVGTIAAEVLVIMEPTRNAWVPLAAWFRRRGAQVVLVAPERTADLRRYYAKHAKSDRLDSQLLARLPLLHPDGLHREDSLGPGAPLKRAAKLHSTLTHRRTQSLARIDALLEILGPAWHAAIGSDLGSRTVLKLLAAGYAATRTCSGASDAPAWPASAIDTHAGPGASRWLTRCSPPRRRPCDSGPPTNSTTPTWLRTSHSKPGSRCN
jgi:transposase